MSFRYRGRTLGSFQVLVKWSYYKIKVYMFQILNPKSKRAQKGFMISRILGKK